MADVFVPERKSRWTFIRDSKNHYAFYKCDCGVIKELNKYRVKYGKTLSCGCFRREFIAAKNTTHSLSNHPLYGIWKSMVERCHNPKNKQYPDYGGRGITVCDEWKNDFVSFYQWAISNGWNSGLHLDKDISGKMIYSPLGCRFVTRMENNREKRGRLKYEINGEYKTMKEWADTFKISYHCLWLRMFRRNMSLSDALTKPISTNKWIHTHQ